MLKKISLTGIGLAFLAAPVFASADTLSDLRARIQALLSQVQQLRSQSTSSPTATAGTASCPKLSHALSRGSRGDEVTKLQNFLVSQGLLGPESVTGFFGPATQKAVQQWQASNGVVSSGSPSTTGYGSVGPRTRSALARCSGTTTTTPPTTQTTPPTTTAANTGTSANTGPGSGAGSGTPGTSSSSGSTSAADQSSLNQLDTQTNAAADASASVDVGINDQPIPQVSL